MSSKQLVWLITGTSSGFGRDLTLALLKRGDKVIATGRSLSRIQDLKVHGADVFELDVTFPLEKLKSIVAEAVKIYGRVDVLVNNAAYIAIGALEENTPEETYDQFNTNIFGVLNVTRAVLPYMRERKSGTVVWLGSIGGWIGLANGGLYIATKHAIRGLAETLSLEITPLGLKSLYIEPGYFRTAFLEGNHRAPYNPRIADYNAVTKAVNDQLELVNGKQIGDPKKLVEVMADLVRGEGVAAGRVIPSGLPLGSDTLRQIRQTCHETLEKLDAWEDVIASTDFPEGA